MGGEPMSVYVIAEAGVNHNGSPDLAVDLVDAAAKAGADAVKFQTFKAERMISTRAAKAAYQTETTGSGETQLDMVRRLELDSDAHRILLKRCTERGIDFLSSPFDEESVDFLTKQLHVTRLKIPSGEITNGPLLLHIAKSGVPVILSTGMSMLADIEEALAVLAFGYSDRTESPGRKAFARAYSDSCAFNILSERVVLLHCTTEYPAPYDEINLRAMDTLHCAFGLPVGYSDHTQGLEIALAAAARGACVIEKHFTMDRNLAGPDHRASLEPDELKAMVTGIRRIEQALGAARKMRTPHEEANMLCARKSLVASCAIEPGTIFSNENMARKRPGDGVSPMAFWDVLGTPAHHSIPQDFPITP